MTDFGIKDEEINSVCYHIIKEGDNSHPFLILGGQTGCISIFNLKKS